MHIWIFILSFLTWCRESALDCQCQGQERGHYRVSVPGDCSAVQCLGSVREAFNDWLNQLTWPWTSTLTILGTNPAQVKGEIAQPRMIATFNSGTIGAGFIMWSLVYYHSSPQQKAIFFHFRLQCQGLLLWACQLTSPTSQKLEVISMAMTSSERI